MNSQKKNIIIAVLVAIIAVGVYFAFFHKDEPTDHFKDAAESVKDGFESIGE
jgi:hypothetical protein